MAESIAKGTVTLTVDGGQAEQQLSSFLGKLKGFKDAASKYAAEQAKLRAPDLLPTLRGGAGAGSFILGGLAVSGITSAFHTITSSLQNTRREIAQAKGLGFSQDFFAGVSLQARTLGLDLEETSRGWTHYQQLQGEALNGSDSAERTFRQLGVSLQDLQSGNQEQVFRRIADSVNGMTNPLDKAMARIELFGVKQQSLGRVFIGGSAGISASQQQARASGLAMSQGQADAVESAVRAWTAASARVDAAWSTTIRGWSAQAAPILEMVAKAIEGPAAGAGQQSQSWVQSLPRAAAIVVAQIGESTMEGLMTVGKWLLETVRTIVKALADYLPRFAGGGDDGWARRAEQRLRGAANFGENERRYYANSPWSRALEQYFDRFDLRITNTARPPQSESQILEQRARAFRDQLELNNRFLGYSTEEIERERLARAGLRSALLEEIDARLYERRQLQDWINLLTSIDEQRAEGHQITQQLETPLERFRREMTELEERRRLGFINDTTLARGVQQQFAILAATLQDQHTAPGALAGSEEAARIIQMARVQREDPAAMVRRILEQALQIDTDQLGVQREILSALRLNVNRILNPRPGDYTNPNVSIGPGVPSWFAPRPNTLPWPFTSVGGTIGGQLWGSGVANPYLPAGSTGGNSWGPANPYLPGAATGMAGLPSTYTPAPIVVPPPTAAPVVNNPYLPAPPAVANPYLPTSGAVDGLNTTAEQTLDTLEQLLELQQQTAQAAGAPSGNPYLEVQIVE